MKDSTILILVGAAILLLFWAFSKGIISSGAVPVGGGVVAPQPSQNYGGYVAASTAPGVASALNGLLTGIGSSLHAWLTPSTVQPAAPLGASPSSPAGAAQPSGPALSTQSAVLSSTLVNPVGPITVPQLSYDATSGSAFNYDGMAAYNGFDSSESLQEQTA